MKLIFRYSCIRQLANGLPPCSGAAGFVHQAGKAGYHLNLPLTCCNAAITAKASLVRTDCAEVLR
jgi:hypothetical protein